MSRLNRRRFMQIGLGAAGALAAGAPELASAQTTDAASERGTTTRSSVERAYRFQNQMMDAYQQGGTLRLVQSYSDQQGLGSTALPTTMR